MKTNDLTVAIKGGQLETVREVVTANPALLQELVTPSWVLLALYYGQPAVAAELVTGGAPVGIFEAAALGEGDRLNGLLQQQPELLNAFSDDGFQPLPLAIFFGHTTLALDLLKRDAEVHTTSKNAQRVTALHAAVSAQDLAVAEALIAAGANVNASQQNGFTPLQGAAQNGQLPMLEALLAAGADVNAVSDIGKTALALALEGGHEAVAARLRTV